MLQTRVERLVAIVREHGIPLPGEDPLLGAADGEHLAACHRVVTSAYDLLQAADEFEEALGELRRMVGSGLEMLDRPWR